MGSRRAALSLPVLHWQAVLLLPHACEYGSTAGAALSVKPSSPSNPQLFLTCSLPASRTLGSYPIQTEWVERRRCRSLEEQRSQILFSTQRCEGRGGRIEGGEASRRSEVVQLNMRISGGNLLQRWRLIFTCLDSCWTFLRSSFICHTEGLSVYHEFTKHSTNSSFYLCFYGISLSLFLYLQSEVRTNPQSAARLPVLLVAEDIFYSPAWM